MEGDQRFLPFQVDPAKQLVRLFDVALKSEETHYLVHLPEGLEKPGVAAFKDWIMAEMRQFHASADWPG